MSKNILQYECYSLSFVTINIEKVMSLFIPSIRMMESDWLMTMMHMTRIVSHDNY